VRSALLLKLILLERLGLERGPLVHAQRIAFEPHLDRLHQAPPTDQVIALWRHHSAAAAAAFLDELATDDTRDRR
jgi:hypothetical protein